MCEVMVDAHQEFSEFVAVHRGRLSRVAYLLTGDLAAAEDLLQVALTKTAMRWTKLREQRPEAFIRKVLYHDAISAWRRRRREMVTEAVPDSADRDDMSERIVLRVIFAQALGQLTPRQRAVLVLRFYEDRSIDETAELLGCSPGTIKSQTSAALDRLRKLAPELAGSDNRDGQRSIKIRKDAV